MNNILMIVCCMLCVMSIYIPWMIVDIGQSAFMVMVNGATGGRGRWMNGVVYITSFIGQVVAMA